MTKDFNTILEKLRKLVEHEQSARKIGSINEANAFAAKIAHLCDNYRIEMASLGKEEVERAITVKEIFLRDHGFKIKSIQPWMNLLGFIIAQGHGCKWISTKSSDFCGLVGLEGDANVAAEMVIILLRFALTELRKTRKEYKAYIIRQPDFMQGFAFGLRQRYAQRSTQTETESKAALIRIVDETIENYCNKEFRAGGTIKPKFKSLGSADLGHVSAQKANLDTNQLRQTPRAAIGAQS